LIDGNLPPEAKLFLLPMLSRIKIMSNLSITEKRLPQDGSAVVRTNDQDLDLRISTIPTPRGESMVIRILPTKSMRTTLESLGFNKHNATQFRNLITKPHGIIFVTGPTGSGKTTTLYACLNELNRDEHKIITIEDPIEYEMQGITQIQINQKIHFGFAEGLRSILRHDPDIIMVGEVRDLDTAEIAIRTALTGHLVFSTLHTNDAASGISRLIDMGVEPYLVASSVEAFVAQRLVRVICPQCKVEDLDSVPIVREEMVRSLSLPSNNFKIYKGSGCDHCHGTGFFGRTAIYEILPMTEAIRILLSDQPHVEEIKKAAIASGMQTLRQNGWQCVYNGLTTPSEVMYVAAKDSLEVLPANV
jgi:type II secretory ATPase GspE/PulE/Tfp pilus assembly ATPase PilB-like protein